MEFWLRYRVRYVRNWLKKPRTGSHKSASTSESDWQNIAQEGEFAFHRTDTWRVTSDFMDQSEALFAYFGFIPDDWEGKTVLDLGAGSKLRSKYFFNSKIIVIEPLADRFIREISWSDLSDAHSVHSVPAEHLVEELTDSIDLVISINVLDHCFNIQEILNNIEKYLRPNGIAFISFDKHTQIDELHPLVLTEKTCIPLIERAGLEIVKQTKGLGSTLRGRQTYGHGPYALNFWLRPKLRA